MNMHPNVAAKLSAMMFCNKRGIRRRRVRLGRGEQRLDGERLYILAFSGYTRKFEIGEEISDAGCFLIIVSGISKTL